MLGFFMKEQTHYLYNVILLILVMILQACGSSNDEAPFSISADINEISFSHEFLQPTTETIAIQVNFEGDGLLVGYAPGVTPTAWLEYRADNVTDSSATIYIDVINGEFFLAGTYTTTLRLATSNDDASNFAFHDIDISLLIWNLSLDTDKVNYSGTFGDASIAAQDISIASDDNSWTASVDVDWLSLDVSAGTGNGTITLTPDLSGFTAPGLQQANLILTEATSGDTKSIPVELALDNPYLFADRTAVALTSTAAISAVSTTVAISHNGAALNWQAATDANWLTVMATADNQLLITANPTLAPLNQVSTAKITIAATQNSQAIGDIITVNFYNSDLLIDNKVLTPLAINDNEMLVSPLLPVFYVAVANQLHTYQQYTGELQASLTVSPENTVLEQLIMHPNGDYLLAKAIQTVTENETTTEVVHRYKIDLSDNSVTELLDADIRYEPLDIVRLSGRYFVVTQTLEFANEALQVVFWDSENAYFSSKVGSAKQANTLFALDYNNASLKRYTPAVNDFGDQLLTLTLTHEYHPELLADGDLIYDFVVTNDEANIYVLSATSEWLSFDGETFTDNGLLETNANVVTLFLQKNNADQANYLRIDTQSQLGFYLATYDQQQTLISSSLTSGKQPSSLVLSADDQQLIINVDTSDEVDVDSQIELVTLFQ